MDFTVSSRIVRQSRAPEGVGSKISVLLSSLTSESFFLAGFSFLKYGSKPKLISSFPFEDFKHERLIRLVAVVVLMAREGFYIIRCPRCGRYTYASTHQKTRLCVYCQKIFKINPLDAVFVDDAKTARSRVKFYQTGKHYKDYMDAVEKSRDKIQSLIPDTNLNLEQLQDSKQITQPVSMRRRELERILYQRARKEPLDLEILEQECLRAGVSWEWVVQQIESLIRSGHLISPKPWLIQLVTEKEALADKQSTEISSTKLAQLLRNVLRDSSGPVTQDELATQLEKKGVSSAGIEEALNLLRNQGYVLKTSTGTYRWTGD